MDNIPRFEVANEINPTEWLNQFRLVAKLNKWDQDDWIDLVQLKLGRKELIWYKKNIGKFTDWTTFTVEFKDKFVSEEQGYMSYDKLKAIRQENYNSVEELEYALEEALSNAGIEENQAKFNWLVSSLKPEVKVKIRERKITLWDDVVNMLAEAEKHNLMDNQQSLSRETNYTKDNRDQVLTRNESGNSSSNINYQDMLHKMEEWSVNILTKVDEAVERRLRLVQYGNKSRPRYPPRQVRCFNCQKIGHKRHECP
ncbi:hypothetical protein AX774_g6423 [Zancudomyces culisetae]|uniref:CCHC-type domain-containing protein n=1 Tax=Zancudomyces culisetae TaxID=1213189 RepID=A0A1R1PGS8_ZANCU|nr:hypothetical protein AX774_g6423 [Zancudomyces culisetae]|eukprot:OMH80148.1 hypothetical protein AX774_g6423 [Zancudomyces culisetae]